MSPASHEDAALVVQLAQWGSMMDVEEAIGSVFDEDFDPDAAEANDDAAGSLYGAKPSARWSRTSYWIEASSWLGFGFRGCKSGSARRRGGRASDTAPKRCTRTLRR